MAICEDAQVVSRGEHSYMDHRRSIPADRFVSGEQKEQSTIDFI